ncbi:CaiB/BaiF CoA transferase family protein [Paraburkholderia oxyphila]|uniref:CaiB/BaiF CoA transferase family protein n=1 Tax=Paraburkholderia oxyphila TaxID=614212 RepID=UPI0005B7B724|nr:CoA transferase [Paraburkholderia oxyphila]
MNNTVNSGVADAHEALKRPSALEGLRVVDMSGLAGQYCGKQFSDLGAEVILVEPLNGSSVRREGPFLDNHVDPEYSLPFTYFNAGKKSVCLDLDRPEGQRAFIELVKRADLLIESEKPGVMAKRGLDYASLAAVAPDLVMTSITPFGQDGPYANYESEDIVALALGGMLYLGGYPDSPPIAAHGNLAYLAAAQFASVASMIALLGQTGEPGHQGGSHIDVSIQECVVMGMENAIQFYDLERVVRKRESGQLKMAGTGVFDCADGQIYLMAGGIASARFWESTVQWMIDDGVAEAAQLLEDAWKDHDYLVTEEAKHRFSELFVPFAKKHTKVWLYQTGQERRIPVCPISMPKDIIENRQLAYREFFGSIKHLPSGQDIVAPGAPYRFSETPWHAPSPAPLMGQHTDEILAGLGYGKAERSALQQAGVSN